MDPSQLYPSGQPFPIMPLTGSFVPGIYPVPGNNSDYLASLDSDTRDYVLKHTDASRTQQDILNCVNELHSTK